MMGIQLLIILAIHIGLALADPLQIPRDGEIDFSNYDLSFSGLRYHSNRWEPLCGSITRPFDTYTLSDHCIGPLNRYSNDTSRTFGLYERGGTRLEGAIIGGGRELCMCFSVSAMAGFGNDICFSFGPTGDLETGFSLDLVRFTVVGAVRSGSAKALPHCADVDIASLQSSWSATAVMPSVTPGPVSTIGPTTATAMLTPSVANVTMTSYRTYTNSQGQTVTEPVVSVTQAPVILVSQADGLPRHVKIALGLGLGIGLPTFLILVIGLSIRRDNDRKRERRMYEESSRSHYDGKG